MCEEGRVEPSRAALSVPVLPDVKVQLQSWLSETSTMMGVTREVTSHDSFPRDKNKKRHVRLQAPQGGALP
jgi:hypothetical protein